MKNKLAAILLAFFLGTFGIHKFYLGQTKAGILYLIFCWTIIPTILSLIDFVMLIIMTQQEFDAKYNNGVNSAK
ncbi:MAG: TM2 domain-containing protein [Marinifilaceae bacterium]